MTRPPTNVDAAFDDAEPTPVPAMPSRAFEPDPPELRARQVSAMGGEVRDDALLSTEVRLLRGEMRDGFTKIFKALMAIERHEVQIQETRRDLHAQADQTRDLVDRVTPLERKVADVVARVKKLETAAERRRKT